MIALDAKVYGVLFKAKDSTPIPPDEYIVFRASDNALEDTLVYYLGKCLEMGADQYHIAAIHALLKRLRAWRKAHPERCKTPDTTSEETV